VTPQSNLGKRPQSPGGSPTRDLRNAPRVLTLVPMRAGLLRTSLRFLTWCCVAILAFLSLLPAQDMVRAGFPGPLEHFSAYAGSGAIAMAGYGLNRGAMLVVGGFWLYAGILEYLQHFSAGRHPALEDFAASALGALCGGIAVVLFWRYRSTLPGWRDTA
jgi:VanZ family protein